MAIHFKAPAPLSTYKPSYMHCVGTEPLFALTLGQLVQKAAEKWGEKEAFFSAYEEKRYSFKEAQEEADRLAAGLLQLGLVPGDRVGIWGPNSSGWYISRLATARAGLVAIQLDPAYQPPQLLHALTKVEAKALICGEEYKSNSYYQMVLTLIPELNGSPERGIEINSSKLPALKTLIFMSNKQYRGAYKLEDIISSASPEYIQEVQRLQTLIQPDDESTVQLSSGTTGTPKAVLTSHHSAVNCCYFVGRRMDFNMKVVNLTNMLHKLAPFFRDEVTCNLLTVNMKEVACFFVHLGSSLCVTAQFCHSSGCFMGIFCSLHFGNAIVLPAPIFDAKKTLETIIQERCTHLFGTPSLYVDLVTTSQDLDLKVTTLQAAVFGGAPCSQQLALQMKNVLNVTRLYPCYGMTEVLGVFCSTADDSLEQTTVTVGRILEHCEVKVVDREGRMVPIGTPGELWVRSYSVMLGYINDEEKTREFIRSDGWAKTGDEFVLQEDGYGRIVGRVKDVIIRIGDKIFPSEIEELFEAHPDIVEAQAFGVPDPKVGEEICVYFRLHEGATLTEQDIIDYAEDKVPSYRIPRYIRFTSEFARTASTGKIQKKELLAKLLSEIHNTN